jgi:hypothetical protein
MQRWLPISLPLGALLATVLGVRGQEPPDVPANSENIAAALKLTQAAAAEYEIRTGTTDDEEKPLELKREPVLRWSNPAQGEVHGNVFLWTRGGRPYVVGSLFKWFTPFTHMAHEFQSLSEGSLRVSFHGKPVWNPTMAGVRFEAVPGAPAPAPADAQRLVQLKQIARDFAVTKKERDGTEAELRLLPQPIHRYAAAKDGIHAGALFAFVQGTDPDLFLLIEARGKDAASARWQFAATRMNSVQLQLRHRDKEVWKAEILPWKDVSDRSRPYTSFGFKELPDFLREAAGKPK